MFDQHHRGHHQLRHSDLGCIVVHACQDEPYSVHSDAAAVVPAVPVVDDVVDDVVAGAVEVDAVVAGDEDEPKDEHSGY